MDFAAAHRRRRPGDARDDRARRDGRPLRSDRLLAAVWLDQALDVPAALDEVELLDHLARARRSARRDREPDLFRRGGAATTITCRRWSRHSPGRAEFATSYTPYQPELVAGSSPSILRVPDPRLLSCTGWRSPTHPSTTGRTRWSRRSTSPMRVHQARAGAGRGDRPPPLPRRAQDLYLRFRPGHRGGRRRRRRRRRLGRGGRRADAAAVAVAPTRTSSAGSRTSTARVGAWLTTAGALVDRGDRSDGDGGPRPHRGSWVPTSRWARDRASVTRCRTGDPYVGLFATKLDLVRQVPGRIAGETVDADGRRAFVLTLQAPRAAHPPGEGDLQRVHQPDADGHLRDGLPRLARARGPASAWGRCACVGPRSRPDDCRRLPGCESPFDGPTSRSSSSRPRSRRRTLDRALGAARLPRRARVSGRWYPELDQLSAGRGHRAADRGGHRWVSPKRSRRSWRNDDRPGSVGAFRRDPAHGRRVPARSSSCRVPGRRAWSLPERQRSMPPISTTSFPRSSAGRRPGPARDQRARPRAPLHAPVANGTGRSTSAPTRWARAR